MSDMAKVYTIRLHAGFLLCLFCISTTISAQLVRGDYMTGKSLPRQDNLIRADPEIWLPAAIPDIQLQPANGNMLLTWQTSWERDLTQFDIEYSTDNIHWRYAGSIMAHNEPQGAQYRFSHTVINADRVFYRLKMTGRNGTEVYTSPVSRYVTGNARNAIPTLINNHTVTLFLNEAFEAVIISDMNGTVLRRQQVSGRTGRIDIALPQAANGICVISLWHVDTSKNIAYKVLSD
jgi:hypothetical protein